MVSKVVVVWSPVICKVQNCLFSMVNTVTRQPNLGTGMAQARADADVKTFKIEPSATCAWRTPAGPSGNSCVTLLACPLSPGSIVRQ